MIILHYYLISKIKYILSCLELNVKWILFSAGGIRNVCKTSQMKCLLVLTKMSMTIRAEFSSRIGWTILMLQCDYEIKIKRTHKRRMLCPFPRYDKWLILIQIDAFGIITLREWLIQKHYRGNSISPVCVCIMMCNTVRVQSANERAIISKMQ